MVNEIISRDLTCFIIWSQEWVKTNKNKDLGIFVGPTELIKI